MEKRNLRLFLMSGILGISIFGVTNLTVHAASSRFQTTKSMVGSKTIQSILVANNKQEFYNILKNKLENFQTNVTIKVKNYNSIDYGLDIFNKIVKENPTIDYGYEGVQGNISGYPNSPEKTLNLTIKYRTDKETMKSEKRAVKNKVQEIINEVIKPGMNDVEKELVLHDYLVKNAEYNVRNNNLGIVTAEDHNAYGVLINNTGVCESYAKAMYELLKAVGIECKYVTGTSIQGGHAWNMVRLDGQWYNLDVTWDDSVFNNGSGNNMMPISHKYFNVPDYIFNRDHRRGILESNYPQCNSIKYYFENLNIDEYTSDGKLFVNIQNQQQLDNEILNSLINRDSEIYLKLNRFNININILMQEIKNVARRNRIYGFGFGVSMSDKYAKVTINW